MDWGYEHGDGLVGFFLQDESGSVGGYSSEEEWGQEMRQSLTPIWILSIKLRTEMSPTPPPIL